MDKIEAANKPQTFNPQKAFAPPTSLETAWKEREAMIKSIINAGIQTMRRRATKHVLAREKEAFYRNAQERKPQAPLTLDGLLSVFNNSKDKK